MVIVHNLLIAPFKSNLLICWDLRIMLLRILFLGGSLPVTILLIHRVHHPQQITTTNSLPPQPPHFHHLHPNILPIPLTNPIQPPTHPHPFHNNPVNKLPQYPNMLFHSKNKIKQYMYNIFSW